MKLDAILFDLDGTLLPMDNDAFTRGYLHLLAEAMKPHGYHEETMIPAMWRGVSAMIKNDGRESNMEAFCRKFGDLLGIDAKADIPYFDAFYTRGFHKAKAFTSPSPLAKRAVELARRRAERVVLATNPLFPRVAIETRLGWAGLSPDDFDLITDYASFGTCKPNHAYYTAIMQAMGTDPARSLMIGNNADEDVRAASAAGLATYLLTDCLIGDTEDLNTQSGSFDELLVYLESLSDAPSGSLG